MGYDPETHHRHSLRLKGHDYKQPGMYFVTLCSWHAQPLFEAPRLWELVTDTWQQLPTRFPTVTLDMFVCMPNHMHGILSLGEPLKHSSPPSLSAIIGAYKSITTVEWIRIHKRQGLSCSGHLWQQRFYDHIIRNDQSLQGIRQYILDNPLNAIIRQGKELDEATWQALVNQYLGESS